MAKSRPRAFFEDELLPVFAARFPPEALVVNIGSGRHSYREHFACRVVTADRDPAVCCDQCFAAERIPYEANIIDGIVFMGVFERLDDPMQAMRELYRVLRPGGCLLMSALDLNSGWRKETDRWRLSPAGARLVVRDFTVLAYHHLDAAAHFLILQKPVSIN